MYQLALIIHIIAAACIIVLVMLQQGKGAGMGASFGSGASQTVFGSRGSGSFLLKITIGFVVVFFSTSLALNHMAVKAVKQEQQAVLPLLPLQQTDSAVAPPVSPSSIPLMPNAAQPVENKK